MAVAQILTSLARPALNAEPTAIPEDLSAWATAFTRITKHILVTIRAQLIQFVLIQLLLN